MPSDHLGTLLNEIEQQFDVLSVAIVQGEPVELDRAAAVLKGMAGRLSTLLQGQVGAGQINPGFKARILSLRDGLNVQRISLIRRTVHVEGALNVLIPSSHASTYSAQSGRYGANVRQTGAFKVLAA